VVGSLFLQTFSKEATRVDQLKVPGFLGLMVIGLVLYVIFRRLEQQREEAAINISP